MWSNSLLGRYCASTDEKEIAEGLEIVEKQLKDRTVRTGDQEIFKARARDTGPVKLIDLREGAPGHEERLLRSPSCQVLR